MIIAIKNKIFNENNTHSIIIGQHGKEPWDFEITAPISPENYFLESCLYEDIVIEGADTQNDDSAKCDYTITKIEKRINKDESVYIVSGIGKAERLLETSVSRIDIPNMSGFTTGWFYVVQVLSFVTGVHFDFENFEGIRFNFKHMKKGEFLSEWFWGNFKQELALCKFINYRNGYKVIFKKTPGDKDFLMNSFVSQTTLWENRYDMFYALANNFLIKYQKTSASRNPMPQPVVNTYPVASSISTESFRMTDLEKALGKVMILEDASGQDLGLKVEGIVADLSFQFSQYFAIFIQTKTLTHTSGVRIRLKKLNTEELLQKVSNLHLRRYPYEGSGDPSQGSFPDLGTGTIVDGSVWFSEWKSNSHEGPIVPYSGTVMYGIGITGPVGKLERMGDGTWKQSSFSITLDQDIADIAAVGLMDLPNLPEGRPHSDYEISEEQFVNMDLGDNIVDMYGDSSILTDKVITFEKGEVHYDCTTKDLLEIEAKQ